MFRTGLALGLSLACTLAAQTTLKYTGAPLGIAAGCSQDDLVALRLTCPADHPCPVYLDLTGIDSAGSRVFIAGNLHTDDATLSSILLASQDGGVTWSEPHRRIRGAGLDLVQFLDFATGWASGESLGEFPRDPFLLLTRDGGKSWRSCPVFEESRAGAIDSFYFDSAKHGRLWIGRPLSGQPGNRYEAYESEDGGETWALRQAGDQPLPPSPHPAPSGLYRLEADRATGSYRVEHRAEAGWERVAAFLVQAGECREPDAAAPPQP
jgi:hypothetical protein